MAGICLIQQDSFYVLSHATFSLLSSTPAPPGDASEVPDKKARLAEDLSEKILHRPGPLELVKKNILPLDPGIKDAMTGNDDLTASE